MPLFEGLSPHDLALLATTCRLSQWTPSKQVLRYGEKSEKVYLVLQGTLKIVLPPRPDDQQDVILINLAGPGDILGEIHALDGQGHSASVVTAECTTLLCLERQALLQVKARSPLLDSRLETLVTGRLRALTARQVWIANSKVEERVGRLLLNFAGQFAPQVNRQESRPGNLPEHPDADQVAIPLRLPQSDIASLVGACRYRTGESLRILHKVQLIVNNPCHRITVASRSGLDSWCANLPK